MLCVTGVSRQLLCDFLLSIPCAGPLLMLFSCRHFLNYNLNFYIYHLHSQLLTVDTYWFL